MNWKSWASVRSRPMRWIAIAGIAVALGAGGCAQLAEKERELTFRVVPGDASWYGGLPDGVVELDIPVAHADHIHAWWWPAKSANAPAVDPVSRAWTLSAAAGPVGPNVFHFFLADGTEPPFADRTFDTVVTPWFIDQVPTDLDALLRRVHALLAPGGRWINHGPLIYRPDTLAIARWYTRQEIFELAAASGFRMGAWETAVQPHLVSPLTGRGLIENVLTFEATRA